MVTARKRGVAAAAAALIVAILALGLGTAAQAQSEGTAPHLAIREIDGSDPGEVKVTFLWTGPEAALSSLVLREDGDTQSADVTGFRNAGGSAVTAVVVDTSDSMGDSGALAATKDLLREWTTKLSGNDEIALVSYTGQAHVEAQPTTSAETLLRSIDDLVVPRDAKSALYDGIRRASLLTADRAAHLGNVLVITDGGDDSSTADLDQTAAAVAKSGAALFVIDLQHDGGTDRGSLQSIVDRTGGAIFDAPGVEDLEKAFDEATMTMQKQYVASYESGAEQGDVGISLTLDGVEQRGSFVVGSKAQGAGTAEVLVSSKSVGPSFLRGQSAGLLAIALLGLAFGLGTYAFVALTMRTEEGLDAVLRPYEEGGLAVEEEDHGLAQTAFLQRAVEMTEDFAERQGLLDKVARMLERADIPLRAAEALFFYVAAGAILGFLGFLLWGFSTGAMVLLLLLLGPPAAINYLAGKRSKAFQSQLPDTLQLLAGSLRAGYSLLQGVETVSREVEEPMGKELRRVMTEAQLGRDVEEALDGVAERMESPDFAWAVMAIRVQREVGGNLSELLDTVSETMVQRERLRRDINSLTAEGKISAIILGLLPVGLGFFMYTMNPDYMAPLGAETLGRIMLGLALVAALIGFAWMKKIISIET